MFDFWIILLFVIIFFQFLLMKKNKSINKLFNLFLFVSFLMWYFVPLTLTMFGIEGILNFLRITRYEYYELAIKELILYFLIIACFNLLSGRKKIIFSNLQFVENISQFQDKIFTRFTVIFLIIYLVFVGINQMDYQLNNNIELQQGGLFQLLTFFATYLLSYLWINIIYDSTAKKRIVAIFIIIFHTFLFVVSGSRIYVLSIVYLLFFIIQRENNIVKKIRNYIILGVFILASFISLPFFAAQRSGVDAAAFANSENIGMLVLEELNIKLNSISYGTVLMKYDGEEFAGFTPYVGSLVKFVPRFIWKSKPTATSFNEDISGIPSRRTAFLITGDADTFNTGISTYAVAAWQMGFWTVFLTLIFNVILFKFINSSLKSSSFYIKSFGFMLLGFPQLVMLPTYGDNIVQKLIEAILIFILLVMFGFFKLIRIKVNTVRDKNQIQIIE